MDSCVLSFFHRQDRVLVRGLSWLLLWLFVSFSSLGAGFGEKVDGLTPTAFHVALNVIGSLTVNWYTAAVPPGCRPVCQYGPFGDVNQLKFSATGNSYAYNKTAGGFEGCLHVVQLAVNAKGTVFYRCRVDSLFSPWSALFKATLRSTEVPESAGVGIVLVGDMGIADSDDTMAAVSKSVLSGEFGDLAMVVHAGDISYADDHIPASTNSKVWVKYMERMQAIVAHLPYMTCPGNHEAQFNFTAYLNWLRTPFQAAQSTSESPFYYSFDYLGVHFAMISTEHKFSPGSAQHRWLKADLERANFNRQNIPWIVVVGHRPLYCSSFLFASRCMTEAAEHRAAIEDLLFEARVDVYLCGHNHQYERSFPVFKEQHFPSYVKPPATVYIVNGAAGNIEGNDPTHLKAADVPWRAAHGDGIKTGFMVMAPSRHKLSFVYIESKSQKVADHFTILN